MTLPVKDRKFDAGFALVDKDGRATPLFRDFMVQADRLLALLVAGNAPNLVNAANDAAAAVAGVGIGQFYRNGNVVHMRVI